MICCNATVKQLLLFNYSHNVYKVYDYLFNINLRTVLEKSLKVLDFFKNIWLKYKYIDFKNLKYRYKYRIKDFVLTYKYLYLDPSLAATCSTFFFFFF